MKQLITLPHNLEAESSLLGCLLLKGGLYGTVEEHGLIPADFWETRHQNIFRAIQDVFRSGRTPDLVTVSDELTKRGELEFVGGIPFLSDLMEAAQLTAEAALKDHAGIVADKSLHRQLIKICEDNASLSYRQERDFDFIVNQTTNELIQLSIKRNARSVVKLDKLIDEELGALDQRVKHGAILQGITSGYPQLDNLTTGFKPGEMVVVAGRPGMGKTSFALNMAASMARQGATVLFFTIEMPSSQLVRRIISQECLINAKNFTTGKIEEDEYERLWREVDTLSKLPFYIDESSYLTMADVRSKAKKIRVEAGKLDAVFIDYIQLMHDPSYDKTPNKVREIEHISHNIKLFAKDIGIPVITLAQLSRKIEERKEGVPMLSDLRDSGAIEQDADVVIFIHRNIGKESQRDLTSILVKKNRNGQQGEVKLRFLPHYTKFAPIDETMEEEN